MFRGARLGATHHCSDFDACFVPSKFLFPSDFEQLWPLRSLEERARQGHYHG